MNSNVNNLSADAPTMELDASVIESSSSKNTNSSAGNFQVGVVDTVNRPRFSEETSTLLRSRLQYAALDILVVLSISYIGNFIAANHEWLVLRSVVLASVLLSYVLLRGKRPFSGIGLRGFELILFGGLALQLGLMMASS